MIAVLRRRAPWIRIVVSPCRVQGPGAAASVVGALERIERWGECDVLLLGRGGGSAEDLEAFNEEAVARAVAALETPVVSAVGHEVDVSLCDLVADRRAATPSEAAETVAPDAAVLRRRGAELEAALRAALRRRVGEERARHRADVDLLARGLRARAREARGRMRGAARSLGGALRGRVRTARGALRRLLRRSPLRRPLAPVRQRQRRIDEALAALEGAMRRRMETARRRVEHDASRLEGVSPLAVLARGYSVTLAADGETILRDAAEAREGQTVYTRLARGRIESTVTRTETADGA
jgi:exodeoxyribonuclease VII large subunit